MATDQLAGAEFSVKKKKGKRNFRNGLLLAITIFYWMSMYTYSSLLTPYLDHVGASLAQAGLIVGSYGFTQMILRLPLGILSDHLGRKKIFVTAGLACSMFSTLGFLLTKNVWLILVFRSLAGVAASFWVQMTALYMNYNAENSTVAVGQLNVMNNSGMIIGLFLGGQAISHFGYKAGFALGAAFAFIGVVLTLFLPAEKGEQQPEHGGKLWSRSSRASLRKHKESILWGSLLGALSQYLTFSTGQGFVPQYASGLGASASQISLMTTLNALARVVAIVITHQFLVRHFRPKQILLASMVIYSLAIFALPLTSYYGWLYLLLFLFGMCSGIQMTFFMDAATSHVDPAHRATAMGFYQSIYGVGMVLGPSITGFVADQTSLSLAFATVGSVGFLSLLMMTRHLPDKEAVRIAKEES